MREACRISAQAHELARAMTRPGMHESEVQAAIEAHFRSAGARGPAYG